MKDDAFYLRPILECIRRLEENGASGYDVFLASHTLQDATLRNLQTMTESTQHLSRALKSTYPEIEGPCLAAFRNVLVHNYLGIDLDRIGEVLQRDGPTLKRAVSLMREGLRGKP